MLEHSVQRTDSNEPFRCNNRRELYQINQSQLKTINCKITVRTPNNEVLKLYIPQIMRARFYGNYWPN